MILLSAFAIAALCSYAVYRLVGNRLTGAQSKTTQVVVAAADIKLGSVLRDADLGVAERSLPLPKGTIVNRQQVIGRGVLSNIYEGEPILESRLATPGMRVDVLISGNPPGTTSSSSSEGPQVRTLLQNIEVLSAGTDIQRDSDGKPQQVQVVNLLVNPEQAESLSLASNQTKIQLVLRNPLDTVIAHPPGSAVNNLFAGKDIPVPLKPRPAVAVVPHKAPESKTYIVQVFNGSKRSDQKFVDGEDKQ
jgi:pilus assembly protein CpaB